jgi:osmotically-inducible protein OsmY
MADRTYRSGSDRYERDRPYNRQAEQFDNEGWRDQERGFGQLEGWRDEDYGHYSTSGQSSSRDRASSRGYGSAQYDRPLDSRGWQSRYSRRSEPGFSSEGSSSFTGNDYGARDFDARYTGGSYSTGAGSQLAANRGEWHDPQEGYRSGRQDNGRDGRGWFERASEEVASWFGDDDATRRRRSDYRGHGPSGYTRSDDRIMEDANDRLTDDWGVDARHISVSVSSGEVTLDGTVPSREQKRRAEDVIDDLSGVKHIQNNLRVKENAAWDRNNSAETGKTGTI